MKINDKTQCTLWFIKSFNYLFAGFTQAGGHWPEVTVKSTHLFNIEHSALSQNCQIAITSGGCDASYTWKTYFNFLRCDRFRILIKTCCTALVNLKWSGNNSTWLSHNDFIKIPIISPRLQFNIYRRARIWANMENYVIWFIHMCVEPAITSENRLSIYC